MEKSSHKKSRAKKIIEFDDAKARRALCGSVAVIAVGSIEQHGAHLPVSTDSDIAQAIASKLCTSTGFVLLPGLTFGVSFEHAPKLNISIRGQTLQKLLGDIASSLADAGTRTLIIINGHYGNQKYLEKLTKTFRGNSTRKTIKCLVVPYWKYLSVPFDHGGLVETSLMLVCSHANMKLARKGFVEPSTISAKDYKKLSARASVSFTSVAKNGVWGDPRKATKAMGTRMFKEILKGIITMCNSDISKGRKR